MVIPKFMYLLSVFLLLLGCSTTHSLVDGSRRGTGPCLGPNMPSEIVCQYAMLVTDEASGEKLPLGVVAHPVIKDNKEQQEKDGKSPMENYPAEDKYSLPVQKKDLSKLKEGMVYILHSVPSDAKNPKAELAIIKEMSLKDLEAELGKKRGELFKAMMNKEETMNQK